MLGVQTSSLTRGFWCLLYMRGFGALAVSEVLGQNWAFPRKGLPTMFMRYYSESAILWNHRALIKVHFIKYTVGKKMFPPINASLDLRLREKALDPQYRVTGGSSPWGVGGGHRAGEHQPGGCCLGSRPGTPACGQQCIHPCGSLYNV